MKFVSSGHAVTVCKYTAISSAKEKCKFLRIMDWKRNMP